MATSRKAFFILSGVGALLVGACVAMFSVRNSHPILFRWGSSPESPSARAFLIGNPFRSRDHERIAERLLHDLRGKTCAAILTDNRFTDDPARICEIMRGTTREHLVYREGAPVATTLVYYLPDADATIWIGFARHEEGWGLNSVSAIH